MYTLLLSPKRNSKKNKKIFSMDKKTRNIKITSHYQPRAWSRYKEVPWLNVSGLWLSKAGFEIGSRVEILISENQLIIKPIKQ